MTRTPNPHICSLCTLTAVSQNTHTHMFEASVHGRGGNSVKSSCHHHFSWARNGGLAKSGFLSPNSHLKDPSDCPSSGRIPDSPKLRDPIFSREVRKGKSSHLPQVRGFQPQTHSAVTPPSPDAPGEGRAYRKNDPEKPKAPHRVQARRFL